MRHVNELVSDGKVATGNPMNDVGSGFPVRHTTAVPLHVLGHGRSGTSVFAALCRKYLGIGFGTESQFIVRFYRGLGAYGSLESDENCRRLIADIVRERCFRRSRKFGFEINAEGVFRSCRERTYRGVLDATFRQLSEHLEMSRWGDKTPEYVYHLPVLWELFPDAQYINVVRDGRDVALSSFNVQSFGTKNLHKSAREWRNQLLLVQDFAAELSAEQFMEIRYEDLLEDPVTVFGQVISFLKIDDSEGELLRFIAKNIHGDLKLSNSSKWKGRLTAAERRRYELVAGDLLSTYRYETLIKDVPLPSWWKDRYWDLDDQFRRWSRWAHWKDNLYRARLRMRYWTPSAKR